MVELRDDIILATNVRKNAYSKYSNYSVGAVLMTKNGRIQSICAEIVAFCKAISEGERDFERIVIVGGPKDKPAEKCLPCRIL